MKQFLRGARLAQHYAEWLQFATNPNIGEDRCLAIFRGTATTGFSPMPIRSPPVFSLDPANDFTDEFAATYPISGTIHFDRDYFDDEFTTEVGLMWLRINRPYPGIKENEIAAVLEGVSQASMPTQSRKYVPFRRAYV